MLLKKYRKNNYKTTLLLCSPVSKNGMKIVPYVIYIKFKFTNIDTKIERRKKIHPIGHASMFSPIHVKKNVSIFHKKTRR